MSTASIPTPAVDQYGDGRWDFIHKRFLADGTEQEPEVVFIGDYTVATIGHSEVWEKLFISMHCLNLGIEEDQTQNVLWRIENGEIDTIKPKIIVVAVGFNNHSHSASEVVEGIQACVKAIRQKQPAATIVVLKLFPCGPQDNPFRHKVTEVNDSLKAALQGCSNTQVVDLDPGFVQADGSISHHDMFDYQHLTRNACLRTFEPLADLLQQLINEHTDTE